MIDRHQAEFDYDQLLHPAQVFEDPSEVVNDPDLSLNEKRAILASWASDACAIEASPELRRVPSGPVVRFDDIMEALRELDAQFHASNPLRLINREDGGRGRRSDDDDRGAGLY